MQVMVCKAKRKKQRYGILISSFLLLLSGCGTTRETSISDYYEPTDGVFISNIYGYGEVSSEKSNYESLDDAIAKGKTILTFEDILDGTGISYIVNSFNCDSELYHVEADIYDESERESRRERLKMDLIAGKGPDIMTRGAIWDASKIMNKGCFVDLAPLLEQSGFSDELFFPCYKSLVDEDKIYSITPSQDVNCWLVKKEVIGGTNIPSFSDFIDNLLNYPKDAILKNDIQGPERIMEYLIGDSETLWGIIDWDNKTCDFTGELFYKILDVVKRYSAARNKGYDPIIKRKEVFPGLAPNEDVYENEGWVTVNNWFDDGNHPEAMRSLEALLINANSPNIEGAWAFVSYALSINGQNFERNTPTQREVFDLAYKDMREIVGSEDAEKYYSIPVIEAYKDALESAKYAPTKTEPILDIIYEESVAYCNDDKSKEDVINLIQSRVGIYLAELQ